MSQQELYDLHKQVQQHEILLQEQIRKTQVGAELMDLDQLRFIVSLNPIPPDVAV